MPVVAPGLVGLPHPEGVLRTPSVPPAVSPDENTDAFLNSVVEAAGVDEAGHVVAAAVLASLEALRDRQSMYDVCAARPENRRLAALSADAGQHRRRLACQSLYPPKEAWLFQRVEQNSARREKARVKRKRRREKTRKRSVWKRLCEERGLLRLEREIVREATAAYALHAQLECAAAAADARRALKHALNVDAVASVISLLAIDWREFASLWRQPWGKRPTGSRGVARTTSGPPEIAPGLCGGCQSAAQHRCSGCHSQWYCSSGHQRAHWKVHRSECERLQARHGCVPISATTAAAEATKDDDVVEIGDGDADWGFLADERSCCCCSKAVASAATEAPRMAAAATALSPRHRAALDTSSSPATGVSAQLYGLLLLCKHDAASRPECSSLQNSSLRPRTMPRAGAVAVATALLRRFVSRLLQTASLPEHQPGRRWMGEWIAGGASCVLVGCLVFASGKTAAPLLLLRCCSAVAAARSCFCSGLLLQLRVHCC